jgi:hypothetical protein
MNGYQLTCKACSKLIPAADVNLDKAIAKCQSCNAVFGILDHVSASGGWRELADHLKVPVPAPKSVEVDAWGPELTLTRRWYTHGLWGVVLFCLFWDAFLVVWYTIGLRNLFGSEADGPGIWPSIFMLVFPVFHLAIGVSLTYFAICGFVNRTVVRIAGGELSVWHGPMPWPGRQRLFTSDIKQLYCTETVNKDSDSCRTSRTYNVLAVTNKNDQIKLITGLDDLDQGRYIEQQLEAHLKIRDERVPDEVRV